MTVMLAPLCLHFAPGAGPRAFRDDIKAAIGPVQSGPAPADFADAIRGHACRLPKRGSIGLGQGAPGID